MSRLNWRKTIWQFLNRAVFLQSTVLALAVVLVYGQFLWSPVVFDDINFFDGTIHSDYLGKFFSFDLRWLPYASFEWTRSLLGLDLIWFHLGNLFLHIANCLVLFWFFRRLFQLVLGSVTSSNLPADTVMPLSPSALAFGGALIFALHPAAVYGVAYLSQRSTLMASFFMLLMWSLFLEGLVRKSVYLLIASTIAYGLAVLSKEHAIMAPAVMIALMFLLEAPSRPLFKRVLPSFVLYGLIAIFIVYQVKAKHVLGGAYEMFGTDMLDRLHQQDPGFERGLAYPLSVLTQLYLFFKYLLVWIVPSPSWMSVDMVEYFFTRIFSWQSAAALIGFLGYFSIAVYCLLQRGKKGLFGFALLCPWLLFFTEFSTVRIQESFVIYRSYLWMLGLLAAMPFLFQKVSAKQAVAILIVIVFSILPLTWLRLTTFTHPLLLWDDAARLVEAKEDRPGVERIYYNRGTIFMTVKLYPEAIADFNKAISIYPEYSYAYSNRAAIYLTIGQYQQALDDFTKAIVLNPRNFRSYHGRANVYEKLNNPNAARLDYKESCLRGGTHSCSKF
jgi:hypothetical protein